MGMIQNKRDGNKVYNVGCLGKIDDFKKNSDGRIFINLTGLTRFKVKKEIINNKLYREFAVEYKDFSSDVLNDYESMKNIELSFVLKKIKTFFDKNNLLLNWKEFEKLDKEQQVNTLTMIAPILNEEKQKLLESITLNEKLQTLSKIVEFYLHEKNFEKETLQ